VLDRPVQRARRAGGSLADTVSAGEGALADSLMGKCIL